MSEKCHASWHTKFIIDISMQVTYQSFISSLWLILIIYWTLASLKVKAITRKEDRLSRAGHVVPLLIAVAMLMLPTLPDGFLCGHILPFDSSMHIIGIALVACGVSISIWARSYLGSNWSGTVTLKQNHELIRTGPYRYARRPIYTGLILAFIGTAIALNEWRGIIAIMIIIASFWKKSQREERWLLEMFGDDYRHYRQKVKALLPFIL